MIVKPLQNIFDPYESILKEIFIQYPIGTYLLLFNQNTT